MERIPPLRISLITIAPCKAPIFRLFAIFATRVDKALSARRWALISNVVKTFKPDWRILGSANILLSSRET